MDMKKFYEREDVKAIDDIMVEVIGLAQHAADNVAKDPDLTLGDMVILTDVIATQVSRTGAYLEAVAMSMMLMSFDEKLGAARGKTRVDLLLQMKKDHMRCIERAMDDALSMLCDKSAIDNPLDPNAKLRAEVMRMLAAESNG